MVKCCECKVYEFAFFTYTNSLILKVQIWNTAVNVSTIYDKYLRGTEEGLVRYFKSVENVLILIDYF